MAAYTARGDGIVVYPQASSGAFRTIGAVHFSSRTSTRPRLMPRLLSQPAETSNRSVRLAAPENARHGFLFQKKNHLAASFGTDQVSRHRAI